MRELIAVVLLLSVSVCHGAWDYDPMKSVAKMDSDDMQVVDAAAMQQWFNHIQPQIKEWAKCDYALLSSEKYDPSTALDVKKRLRSDVYKLLPSVSPDARSYHLGIEYTKWFHTWRGYHQGLAVGSDVAPEKIIDAWASDCVKQYGS